jgi:hypothetical protein
MIGLWTLETKLQLSVSYSPKEKNPYLNPPNSFMEGVTQEYKAKIDRDKTSLLMVVIAPTIGMGMYNVYMTQEALYKWFPILLNSKTTEWVVIGIVGIYYVITYAYIKPPTLEKQYHGRFWAWCLWIYVTEAIWHYIFVNGVV